MSALPPVILCGVKEVSAFAITDSLLKKNIKIFAFDTDKKAPGLFHPGVKGKLIVDKLDHNAAKKLCEFGKNQNFPVLIPFDDAVAEFISNYREILSQGCVVFMPSVEVVNEALDKLLTFKKLKNLGFHVPPTTVPESIEDVKNFVSEYGFPAVLKMRFGSGGKQQIILSNDDDLKIKLKPELLGKDLILQSWIPGPVTNLITAAGIRNKNGKISHLFSARRLGVLKSKTFFQGVTTCVESTRNDQLLEYAAVMMDKIDWVGVCELEFKQSETEDCFYLLEINPRFWAWVRLPIFCGDDFAMGYFLGALAKGDKTTDWRSNNYKTSAMYWRALLESYSIFFELTNRDINIFQAVNIISKRIFRFLFNTKSSFIEDRLWKSEIWHWIKYYIVNV